MPSIQPTYSSTIPEEHGVLITVKGIIVLLGGELFMTF